MTGLDKKEIERIKKLLFPVFMESKTKRAYLFGSFSKGTQTRKSDVDLMIITETEKRFFDRYNDYERIQLILTDQSVDMLIYTPDEISKISHRVFIKRILEEGVILYERWNPNGLPELTPEEDYLEEDAINCIENAKKIIKTVNSQLV